MQLEIRLYKELAELKDMLAVIAASAKDVLSVDDAALYLGVSKSLLYKLTSSRRIPHYKPSNKLIFFKRSELEAWVTKNHISEV